MFRLVVFPSSCILLILKILHDFTILLYHNSEGLKYLGSCRIFSIHRSGTLECKLQDFAAKPEH